MARKPTNIDPMTGDGTDVSLPTLPDAPPVSEAQGAAGEPAAPAPTPPPTHTRDRDPAHREAWKRERAKQLGHHR